MTLYESSRSRRDAICAPFAALFMVLVIAYRLYSVGNSNWFILLIPGAFAVFVVSQVSYATTYRIRLTGDVLVARAWLRTRVIPIGDVVSVTGPVQGRIGYVRSKTSSIRVMTYGEREQREFHEFALKLAALADQQVTVNRPRSH